MSNKTKIQPTKSLKSTTPSPVSSEARESAISMAITLRGNRLATRLCCTRLHLCYIFPEEAYPPRYLSSGVGTVGAATASATLTFSRPRPDLKRKRGDNVIYNSRRMRHALLKRTVTDLCHVSGHLRNTFFLRHETIPLRAENLLQFSQ